ncbi:MAG: glycosyltransferase [Spartobacteria bacterium]|nr:glycosyltransferase [Spartobacteria bacterium]
MAGILTLDQMIADAGLAYFPLDNTRVAALLNDPDDNERAMGALWQACNTYVTKDIAAARKGLVLWMRKEKSLSIPVMANVIWSCRTAGDPQTAAYLSVEFAQRAQALGQLDLAMEAFSASVILDQLGRFDITRSPEKLLFLADHYEQIAQSLKPWIVRRKSKPVHVRKRVAMITGNLVDHVVAYSRRVLNFGRFIDLKRFEYRVYSTENLTSREHPLFPFGLENAGSEETGMELIAALQEKNIPVWIAPRDLSYSQTALTVTKKLIDDEIDIAIFQTGMACPVDWLVARLLPDTLTCGIHIGASLFNRGFDLFAYDNEENIRREQSIWKPEFGVRMSLQSGVDIDAFERSAVLSRGELGLDDNHLILGAVSNRLGERLTEDFLSLLCRVMKRHPETVYLGIGIQPGERVMQVFQSAGLADRVRFPGSVSFTAPVLKMMDIYINEFPVGGSESVKEAMASGVPVVAMKWSDAHAESAAAEIIGEPYAVMTRNTGAYEERLEQLIQDAAWRREVGAAMHRRAGARYSMRRYVAQFMDVVESMMKEGDHP